MAFCIGNMSSSRVFFPCSSTAPRTKFVWFGNTGRLFCVDAYRTRKSSIAINLTSINPGPSCKLHEALYLNGSSTRFVVKGELSMDYERKIREIRRLLQLKEEDDPIQKLFFVDAIQRLGVDHHFEEEIDEIIKKIYVTKSASEFQTLHDVSLFFRLLRQNGHYISSDVNNNFKGEDGKFRGELKGDTRGLIELYEATQLRFEGEYTLDEAENFSSQMLNNSLIDMNDYSCRIVGNKLKHPFHKTISKFNRKNFHEDLRGMYEWEETLIELAAMDLHIRQPVYQEELLQVSKWLNELGLHKKLTLARNEPFEFYLWSMVMLVDDINLSQQRMELTKSVAFIYLIDDLFDVYGTPNELNIFTKAINKWDYAAIDTLPNYMKMSYKALLDTTNETCCKINEKYGYNPINALKPMWASLCNAYLVENKWFASGNLPNADEYLENGKDTSDFMSSVAKILRLWNDLGCAKDEHQDGKAGSYIQCYKKDHKNLSTEQAQQHALDMVEIEWKRLNKECMNLNLKKDVSFTTFKKAALNLARMAPLMYSYNDTQQYRPVLETYVRFMFN